MLSWAFRPSDHRAKPDNGKAYIQMSAKTTNYVASTPFGPQRQETIARYYVRDDGKPLIHSNFLKTKLGSVTGVTLRQTTEWM